MWRQRNRQFGERGRGKSWGKNRAGAEAVKKNSSHKANQCGRLRQPKIKNVRRSNGTVEQD
jgi:hypothetical protein